MRACVCVCVCVCVRARMRACEQECVRARARVFVCVRVRQSALDLRSAPLSAGDERWGRKVPPRQGGSRRRGLLRGARGGRKRDEPAQTSTAPPVRRTSTVLLARCRSRGDGPARSRGGPTGRFLLRPLLLPVGPPLRPGLSAQDFKLTQVDDLGPQWFGDWVLQADDLGAQPREELTAAPRA